MPKNKLELSRLYFHIKPYLPLLCGHNAQALSKQKHEPGQRKEILQMREGTTFAYDMTNYSIHTF